MENVILGCIFMAVGYLFLFGAFGDTTKHYSVDVIIEDQYIRTLTFSTVGSEVLTTGFLKNKFNYKSNEKIIITNIKSITREEKEKAIDDKNKTP